MDIDLLDVNDGNQSKKQYENILLLARLVFLDRKLRNDLLFLGPFLHRIEKTCFRHKLPLLLLRKMNLFFLYQFLTVFYFCIHILLFCFLRTKSVTKKEMNKCMAEIYEPGGIRTRAARFISQHHNH